MQRVNLASNREGGIKEGPSLACGSSLNMQIYEQLRNCENPPKEKKTKGSRLGNSDSFKSPSWANALHFGAYCDGGAIPNQMNNPST